MQPVEIKIKNQIYMKIDDRILYKNNNMNNQVNLIILNLNSPLPAHLKKFFYTYEYILNHIIDFCIQNNTFIGIIRNDLIILDDLIWYSDSSLKNQ